MTAVPYEIDRVIVTDFAANCYILWDAQRDCVVIDPGGEPGELLQLLDKNHLKPGLILLTHGHCDHIGAATELCNMSGAKLAIHSDDAPCLEDPMLCGAALFGMPFTARKADILLADGQEIGHGPIRFRVLHTPGHSRGSCSFYDAQNSNLFTGDFVFRLGIGRWDLPGGSPQDLMKSVREKFLTLPDLTHVYPGHGDPTTVGQERQDSPFMQKAWQDSA